MPEIERQQAEQGSGFEPTPPCQAEIYEALEAG